LVGTRVPARDAGRDQRVADLDDARRRYRSELEVGAVRDLDRAGTDGQGEVGNRARGVDGEQSAGHADAHQRAVELEERLVHARALASRIGSRDGGVSRHGHNVASRRAPCPTSPEVGYGPGLEPWTCIGAGIGGTMPQPSRLLVNTGTGKGK